MDTLPAGIRVCEDERELVGVALTPHSTSGCTRNDFTRVLGKSKSAEKLSRCIIRVCKNEPRKGVSKENTIQKARFAVDIGNRCGTLRAWVGVFVVIWARPSQARKHPPILFAVDICAGCARISAGSPWLG